MIIYPDCKKICHSVFFVIAMIANFSFLRHVITVFSVLRVQSFNNTSTALIYDTHTHGNKAKTNMEDDDDTPAKIQLCATPAKVKFKL